MSSERYQFASTIMNNVTRGATSDQKWHQAGPGGWQWGTNKSTNTVKTITNKRKRKHTNEKTRFVFNMRRFPQTSEGSTAGRLPMLYEKRDKTVT